VGRVYFQTVLDCHGRYAQARLYTAKPSPTVVQILDNDVLPFLARHRGEIATIFER
jgi:hypothetical protein